MMGAVWMRARTELRKHWAAWLALALLFGSVAGAAVAAGTGARRSQSAYPRFVKEYDSFDVVTGGMATDDPAEAERIRQEIIRFPEVAEYANTEFVSLTSVLPSGVAVSFPEIFVLGDPGGHELITVNRAKVLEGRMFRTDAADEAVLSFNTADRVGIRLGDRVGIKLGEPGPAQEVAPVRVVGIVAIPGSLPAVGQADIGGLQVSPGFMRAHRDQIPPNFDGPSVRLKRGTADMASFVERTEKLSARIDLPITLDTHLAGVRKTLRFEVLAMWALCGLIALAAITILGQAIARQIAAHAEDHATLLAIGMAPRQLLAVGILRALGMAMVASIAAAGVAIAASPLTPIGLSRLIEPDPGIRVDGLGLLVGALATLAAVLIVSAIPTARAASTASRARTEIPSRPSRAATAAASSGAGPSAVTGLRLALESGRGARAVPLRSALAGVALAVGAFVAAATFTSSLDHLIGTPSLYGFGWDIITLGDESTKATLALIEDDPDVEAHTIGGAWNAKIGETRLLPFVYEPGHGIAPTMLDGRAPVRDDEIALGGSLLRSFNKRIGDTIDVQADSQEGPDLPPAPFKIVGRTVVPPVFFQALEPGQSAALTVDAIFRLAPQEEQDGGRDGIPVIVRYKPGTDLNRKLASMQARMPSLFTPQVRRPGAELSAVSRSSGMPVALTQVLLIMALATLVHVLVTSVRKRRRDLAIMKTLGFVRRQVLGAVAWQATTLTVLALVVGIPAGLALGRLAWELFAGSIGVVPAPHVGILAVALTVPAMILVANMIAAFPARAAARTQPALVLRAE